MRNGSCVLSIVSIQPDAAIAAKAGRVDTLGQFYFLRFLSPTQGEGGEESEAHGSVSVETRLE